MENTDNTLLEMQQQLRQLKAKLDDQKIVNEKILRKSCSQTISRLKFKSNLPIIAGVVAMLAVPSLMAFGISFPFIIFTWVLMLICIAATIYTNQFIPRVDTDMVTAADGLRKYKKINAEWIKFGLPMAAVWVVWLVWDAVRNMEIQGMELYSFLAGIGTGIIVGAIIGLKIRRDQLNGADELLAQLQDLKDPS